MENNIILLDKGTEYIINLNDPEIKSFMDLLSKKGYGEVYFRVKINENGEVYPSEIILDGEVYNAIDPKQIERLKETLEKMQKAVDYVDQNYTSFENLPEHIAHNVYRYHPRWMVMRRLNGLVKAPEDAIKCGMKQILTKESWEKYCFLSVGQKPMKTPGIALDHLMTEEEYSMATLENANKESLIFERMFYKEFMSNYIGDPANTAKLQFIYEELCHADDDKFMDLIKALHAEAVRISNDTVEEILPGIQEKQYHHDLLAFQDTIAVTLSSKRFGIKLKYAKDGFPVIGFKGKKYDLRKPMDEKCFEYDFCEKHGFSRVLKSVG